MEVSMLWAKITLIVFQVIGLAMEVYRFGSHKDKSRFAAAIIANGVSAILYGFAGIYNLV
jgi:hypothetical protein